jgi:hypothetical protein
LAEHIYHEARMTLNFRCGLLAAVALSTVAGCASRGKDWPTLMTPEEQRTGKMAEAALPQPPPPPAQTAPATATTTLVRAATTRLAEAQRDATYITDRWRKQRDVLAATITGLKNKGPADSQWNKAQLELSKLNQIAAEWDDLETVANRLAGQLAVAANGGATIAAPLADAGALLQTIATSRIDAASARDALRKQISR